MHGFGEGSVLKALVGFEVWQVCPGQFDIPLGSSDETRLTVEGSYVHKIPSEGRQVSQLRSTCGPNELYKLPGTSVTGVDVVSTEQAELTFSNGDSLLLLDDSDQYESFLVTSRKRIVVI